MERAGELRWANAEPRRNFWYGLWRLADPRLTLASVSAMIVGAAAALASGGVNWGWLAATVFGVVCIEVAKNAHGEIRDFDSGADAGVAEEDRSPFSGGRRVLVDGILSRGETAAICGCCYGMGIGTGLAIAFWREPAVLLVGLVGVALAWFYYAQPARLAYQGFGEAAVAIAYGPVIACGTYLAQTGTISRGVLLASLPVGLMVAAFLWVNEFPDYRADRAAGKRNLVVRMGRVKASRAFAGIAAAAFVLAAALPAMGLSRWVWMGMAGAPWAWAAARRLVRRPEWTSMVIAAQGWTLASFMALALGLGLGMVLGALS